MLMFLYVFMLTTSTVADVISLSTWWIVFYSTFVDRRCQV